MQPRRVFTRSRFCATLLGVAALSLLNTGSARAQSEMMADGQPAKTTDSSFFDYPSRGTHYDILGKIIAYDTYTGPVFYHYPYSAPGMLEEYDYTDYTGNPFAEGTLYGRVDKPTLLAPNAFTATDDPNSPYYYNVPSSGTHYDNIGKIITPDTYTGPTFFHYPFSAPGMLEDYDYTDYTGNPFAEGTYYGKIDKKNLLSSRPLTRRSEYDDIEDAERYPSPLNYPFAAPGSLHLYHYDDFNQDVVGIGNINDKRMEKDEMRDEKVRTPRTPRAPRMRRQTQ